MTDKIDFTNATLHLTNEQKILATLERIEKLLTPEKPPESSTEPKTGVMSKALNRRRT